jgi:hypothetical protein
MTVGGLPPPCVEVGRPFLRLDGNGDSRAADLKRAVAAQPARVALVDELPHIGVRHPPAGPFDDRVAQIALVARHRDLGRVDVQDRDRVSVDVTGGDPPPRLAPRRHVVGGLPVELAGDGERVRPDDDARPIVGRDLDLVSQGPHRQRADDVGDERDGAEDRRHAERLSQPCRTPRPVRQTLDG